jgi:hydroxylamine oxidation protein HaoB
VLTLPDAGDVIVGWKSEVAEPVLRSDISETEELALITALNKHLPENSTILAMPAVSARLAHFVAADFPLAAAVGQETLRVPAPWAGQNDKIEALEVRWLADPGDQTGVYAEFIDALLAEDVYGAARLQTLAGQNDSYVILHVRDVFDMGVSLPERILVGLRDFPAAGQAHDKARAVKDWANANGHAAYAVERREGGVIRAYFLADAKDKSTLVGQLLPFNTANIGEVAGTTLVYQTGGYWIYRLQPVTDRS